MFYLDFLVFSLSSHTAASALTCPPTPYAHVARGRFNRLCTNRHWNGLPSIFPEWLKLPGPCSYSSKRQRQHGCWLGWWCTLCYFILYLKSSDCFHLCMFTKRRETKSRELEPGRLTSFFSIAFPPSAHAHISTCLMHCWRARSRWCVLMQR